MTSIPRSVSMPALPKAKRSRPRSILKKSEPEQQHQHSRHRELCWGNLTIYEFPNLLGDHPSVTEGPPLTIAWKHTSRDVVDIDYHEYVRNSGRRNSGSVYTDGKDGPRRSRKELWLNGGVRGQQYVLVLPLMCLCECLKSVSYHSTCCYCTFVYFPFVACCRWAIA